ncbi:Gamma-tubulin complex component [Fasciola hepatica]|uniref:Gamma-tubulin complex component n=1 Tax=Fasciola hepatica TaxID=6192 RepID=A0A4E0RX15_FASHE|nr:Gamma-tubulin complex component [Fasciola hepatica]
MSVHPSQRTSTLKHSASVFNSREVTQTPDSMPATPTLVSLWGHPSMGTSRHKLSSQSLRQPVSRSASRVLRIQNTPNGPAILETDLINELIFTLNGVGGNIVKFDPVIDGFCLSPNVVASPGQHDSVRRIAECGWLHDQVRQYVQRVQADRTCGAVAQSLASGLHEHLTEYYRLIATLESQRGSDSSGNSTSRTDLSAPAALPSDGNLDSPMGRLNLNLDEIGKLAPTSQELTLTRLALWTQEPRFRLRFLASLCEACSDKRGGALASEVYAYTLHGDPEVASMTRYLLKNVSETILHLISLWIYDGQLDDPCQEFFVACNPAIKKERLWHDKYSLRRQMIPRFITASQASKILLAGKSINFLQHACGEKRSIKDREVIRASRLKSVESIFEQDLDPSFDQMISTVYRQTSRYLLETLIERYHFLDHLRDASELAPCLKLTVILLISTILRYYIDSLNQSSFLFSIRFHSDSNDLSKPASQLLTHRLSSTLETAIRDTNAQYEQPEILQRLDVRLLDMSTDDTGWDVFSLDYHVDGPLATIFTDDCRLMYLRAFNFLWRAKRMEFSLSTLWKQQIIAARLGHGLDTDLEPVLHLSELLGAEIRHCVQQLQYYISFEVLECAWEILVKQIHGATDLDEVIEAHQAFLTSVITRCLLDAPSRQLIGQLRTIFDLILNFTQLHHELNQVALAELTKREYFANEVAEATRRGKWGTNNAKDAQEKNRRNQFIQRIVGPFQARIRILASSYREMVVNFIRMLCAHPDQSLRFLADHLNFNGHYFHVGGSLDSASMISVLNEGRRFPPDSATPYRSTRTDSLSSEPCITEVGPQGDPRHFR